MEGAIWGLLIRMLSWKELHLVIFQYFRPWRLNVPVCQCWLSYSEQPCERMVFNSVFGRPRSPATCLHLLALWQQDRLVNHCAGHDAEAWVFYRAWYSLQQMWPFESVAIDKRVATQFWRYIWEQLQIVLWATSSTMASRLKVTHVGQKYCLYSSNAFCSGPYCRI